MDSQKVHQAAHASEAGAGVGVEPGGFTPAGGGGETLHRLVKWLKETFTRSMCVMVSQKVHQAAHAGEAGAGVGVEPGGFTPAGGGVTPWRDPPPRKMDPNSSKGDFLKGGQE
jgi:hypothetical protein